MLLNHRILTKVEMILIFQVKIRNIVLFKAKGFDEKSNYAHDDQTGDDNEQDLPPKPPITFRVLVTQNF